MSSRQRNSNHYFQIITYYLLLALFCWKQQQSHSFSPPSPSYSYYNNYVAIHQHKERHHVVSSLSLSRKITTTSLMISKSSRQILEPHHIQQIIQSSNETIYKNYQQTFVSYATCICSASCIPRKEMYESWSTALLIHEYYCLDKNHYNHDGDGDVDNVVVRPSRIADIACGHGLLSWCVLLLSLEEEERQQQKQKSSKDDKSNKNSNDNVNTNLIKTAICIDKKMPKSADTISSIMLQKYPQLHDKWHYVESKLENIVPSSTSSTTLVCGVHACGILTDYIMTLALDNNGPIAFVPCCHSKKSLLFLQQQQQQQLDDDNDDNDDDSNYDENNENGMIVGEDEEYDEFSAYIDQLRIKRLLSSNYQVKTTEIPKEYTPQNRLILASPLSSSFLSSSSSSSSSKVPQQQQKFLPVKTTTTTQKRQRRQRQRQPQQPILYPVPIGDDETSINIIKSLAGRKAANERKQPLPPSLCVSMFMPDESSLNPEILLELFVKNTILGDSGGDEFNSSGGSSNKVQVEIRYEDDSPYLHPNGMYARTFRITYLKENDNRVNKKRAKELHDDFCDKIPRLVNGVRIRR